MSEISLTKPTVGSTGWGDSVNQNWTDIEDAVNANTSRSAFFRAIYPAGSFDYPGSNPAPLDTDLGTNGSIKRHLFDASTEEFVIGQFQLPLSIDSSGTVQFEAIGYAVTAVSSKNIKLKFYYSAQADGESWDTAFSSVSSGDLACSGTQDQINLFSWNETVSNLGWAADDFVRFMVSRITPSSNNLSGDWGLLLFRITIPLS